MDTARSYDSSPASSARGYGNDFNSSMASLSMFGAANSGSAGASAAQLLQGLPPLTLQVAVRDVVLQIEAGTGTQTCKWLATVAAAQYAAMRPEAAPGGTQFVPVHLTDSRGNMLFPADILCEKVEQGETLRLELIGPRLGLTSPHFARERSLWELYAYNSSQPLSLVPVVILFDASELALSAPPGVFGNFNGWGVPMPMNYYRGNVYKFQMDFPAGADLVFKFVVGGASLLTPRAYPIVHDSGGNKLHLIRVAPRPPNASMDRMYVPPMGVSTGGVGVTYPNPALQAAQAAAALDLSAAAGGGGGSSKRVLTLRELIEQNQRAQAAFVADAKLRGNGPELPVLSARVVGTFPVSEAHQVPRSNPRENARRLARDWHDLTRSIGDVFPATVPSPPVAVGAAAAAVSALRNGQPATSASATPRPTPGYAASLSALHGVFSKYHAELSSIFSYYASGTPGCTKRGSAWNLLTFLSFLALVRVPDAARATTARLDRIFFKVIEARETSGAGGGSGQGLVSLSASSLRAHNNSVGKQLLHHEDIWSGLNQLSREEFMQSLLRVAMLKFPNPARAEQWMPLASDAAAEEKDASGTGTGHYGSHKVMTSAAGMAALAAKEAEAKRAAAAAAALAAAPRDPPQRLKDPNPALSLELLMKLHILPYASSGGVVQGAGGNASNAALLNLPHMQGFNPHELRARLLLDPNVFAILRQYSDELARLFKHYAGGGGAEASGLGLGLGAAAAGMPGAAIHAGIIGGANGANTAALPPTLLGAPAGGGAVGGGGGSGGLLSTLLPGPGRGYSASHNPNGSLRSTVSAPLASASIRLRDLEQMLLDYELLDIMLPKQRALQAIGIVIEGANDEGAAAPGVGGGSHGSGASASSSAAGGGGGGGSSIGLGSASASQGEGGDGSFELVYPEFLELLVRIADTGHQWSNLYQAQQKVIAAAYASGALNPLDKVPPSLLQSAGVAGHGGHGGMRLDEEEEVGGGDGASGGGKRSADETELCERFARLMSWIFPNEAEQRERRSKLAAQASASAVPATAAAGAAGAPPGTAAGKDDKAAAGGADGKASAKKGGSAAAKPGSAAAKATPVKKTPAKK